MRSRGALHTLVLDSLADQVAIIDASGMIVDLNAAWLRFARLAGIPAQFTRPGSFYLDLLIASGARGDSRVSDAARGILAMLAGRRHEFRVEYPAGGSGAGRWMLLRAGPLDDRAQLFVVSQIDITDRRRAEEQAWLLAHQDSLTGLANRRHFDERLVAEVRRSVRQRSPLSLIELDVDSFKAYNDGYGHVAGDQCLERIAGVIARHARRPGDLAARLGGDEFALVLAETGYEATGRIAAELRQEIEDLGMRLGSGVPLTVSVGAATSESPLPADGPMALLDLADRALYRAKSGGRNRAVQLRLEGGPARRPGGRREGAAIAP
jgi:diguanylate cyclase (GGDEF)-like protein